MFGFLAGEAEGLVDVRGAEGVDGAEGFVFGAPVGRGVGVGEKDGSAEVVGEGPVGGGAGVDLGDRVAVEPDVLVGGCGSSAGGEGRLGEEVHLGGVERIALRSGGHCQRGGMED